MEIKSLEELMKIKDQYQDKVRLRRQSQSEGEETEILVGMATCGISSGARETFKAFIEELAKAHLENIKVITVGCVGYCHSEPTVAVHMKGQKPVLYGPVKKENVHQIIREHIQGGKPVERLVLTTDFEMI